MFNISVLSDIKGVSIVLHHYRERIDLMDKAPPTPRLWGIEQDAASIEKTTAVRNFIAKQTKMPTYL